ncbi:hypothetical protein JCM14469_09050 [Desulfatiferula olefinivorans]
MTSDEKTRIMEELSEIAISGLRSVVADGRKPTRDALVAYFDEMPEIQNFIDKRVGGGGAPAAEENERLKTQKEKLARQLTAVEERLEKQDRMSRRIMVFLAEWMRNDADEAMDQAVSRFKEALKRTDPELIEEAFNALKTLALRGDIGSGEKQEKPKKSLVGRLMARDSADEIQARYIEQFRVMYQEIINELGLDLGVGFLPRLLHLGRRINSSVTFEDFATLRKDILDLLHAYIETVSTDRESTAEFIRDIGRKLVEVEKDLIRTFGLTDEVLSDNTRFGNALIDDLSDLETTVNTAGKLEELKGMVTSKLSFIKSAVMKKKETDGGYKQRLDEDIHALKTEFEGLKKEALDARTQAEKLEREVFTDPLTGAMNRRAYEKRIKEEFDRYLRYKRTFSTLLFDVDHFKNFNDTYGHATGDTVLMEIIKRVNPLIRESDMLARYGGEEFVVILPETDRKGAQEVAEKLRKTVENIAFIHRDQTLRITISVGVAEVRAEDLNPLDLFNRMDAAMYDAKGKGRNTVAVR